MRLHIKSGRVVRSASGRDAVATLRGRRKNCGRIFEPDRRDRRERAGRRARLIDLSARLREPGDEYKATLESEMDARGGRRYRSPRARRTPIALDEPGLVDMLALGGRPKRFPVRASIRGSADGEAAGRGAHRNGRVAEAGCVAFSHANMPLRDTQLLWRALQYATTFGYPVWLRAEDAWLANGGRIARRRSRDATRPGRYPLVRGNHRARWHSGAGPRHAGTGACMPAVDGRCGGDDAAREAEGLPVSCDVAIHHLHLCDMDLGYFDSHCRLEPPLRSQRDRDALARGLAEGAVDCLCSDHTPVDEDGKHLPFAEASPAQPASSLLLPLTLKWAAPGSASANGRCLPSFIHRRMVRAQAVDSALGQPARERVAITLASEGRLEPAVRIEVAEIHVAEMQVVDRDVAGSPAEPSCFARRIISTAPAVDSRNTCTRARVARTSSRMPASAMFPRTRGYRPGRVASRLRRRAIRRRSRARRLLRAATPGSQTWSRTAARATAAACHAAACWRAKTRHNRPRRARPSR